MGLACACACVRVSVCLCTGCPGPAALQPSLLSHKQRPPERKPRERSFQTLCQPDTPHWRLEKGRFWRRMPGWPRSPPALPFPGPPGTGSAAQAAARAGAEPGCGSGNPRPAETRAGRAIRALTRAGNRQRKRKKSPRQFAYRTAATPSRKLGEF